MRCATSTSTSPSTARARTATFTVKAPRAAQPADIAGIEAAGAAWWPLAMARELDDAILSMRTNELDIGTWLLKTEGDAPAVLALDATLLAHKDHWLVRETIGLLRRTLARLDVSSRTPVRADRTRLVLRRHPARAGASPPTAPTCWRCPTTPSARRRSRCPR